jgi:hypothetical protein
VIVEVLEGSSLKVFEEGVVVGTETRGSCALGVRGRGVVE